MDTFYIHTTHHLKKVQNTPFCFSLMRKCLFPSPSFKWWFVTRIDNSYMITTHAQNIRYNSFFSLLFSLSSHYFLDPHREQLWCGSNSKVCGSGLLCKRGSSRSRWTISHSGMCLLTPPLILTRGKGGRRFVMRETQKRHKFLYT